MAAIDTPAALAALVALVQGLSGMQGTVYQGVPESFSTAVGAYVAVADMEVADVSTGNRVEQRQDFLVVFGYRVKGAESAAELKVAQFKDRFIRALFADRTLAGAVDSSAILPGLAGTPQYLAFAGAETRLYPITVRTVQRETLPTS